MISAQSVVPLVDPGAMTDLLPAVPPFSLPAALGAMQRFTPCSGDQVHTRTGVRRALLRPSRPDEAVVVEVRPRPDGRPGVQFEGYGETPLAPGDLTRIGSEISRWLGLSDD